jgi:hypothetical protein
MNETRDLVRLGCVVYRSHGGDNCAGESSIILQTHYHNYDRSLALALGEN